MWAVASQRMPHLFTQLSLLTLQFSKLVLPHKLSSFLEKKKEVEIAKEHKSPIETIRGAKNTVYRILLKCTRTDKLFMAVKQRKFIKHLHLKRVASLGK